MDCECISLIPQYQQYNAQILPQELAGLQNWFNQVDRDHSGTLEVEELQYSRRHELLSTHDPVTFDGRPIGREVAAKLVQVFDSDRNGHIDFTEYAAMHKFITHMRQAFLAADTDHSGRIEANEIYNALTNAGYHNFKVSLML